MTKSNKSQQFNHLIDNINRLKSAIDARLDLAPAVSSCLDVISTMAPQMLPQVASAMKTYGRFHSFWVPPGYAPKDFVEAQNEQRNLQLSAMANCRSLAWLFMFHGDGFIRQASLRDLTDPPRTAIGFSALVYALNDSVPEVRATADTAARRLFPDTAPAVIFEASAFLFQQRQLLRRWGQREPEILSVTLARQDVLDTLRDRLMTTSFAKSAALFRDALRYPGLDDALPALARSAATGQIRAIALEILLKGVFRYQPGTTFEWVSRSYGTKSWVPKTEERAIRLNLDPIALILEMAFDPSVAVRRVAGSAIIERRDVATPEMIAVMERYANDRSASVREKAAFFFKARDQQ